MVASDGCAFLSSFWVLLFGRLFSLVPNFYHYYFDDKHFHPSEDCVIRLVWRNVYYFTKKHLRNFSLQNHFSFSKVILQIIFFYQLLESLFLPLIWQ